jgi:hypothetical protein
MKTLCAALTMLSLAAFVGCGSSTGSSEKHVGGPGAGTSPNQKEPLYGAGENEFKLKTPTFATSLKQGEVKEIKIGVDPGKGFDKDVTLKFEDVPKGVTLDPASPTIKHGDKEATIKVKAADDAAVGEAKIKVNGHPSEGKDAANTFEIKVEKK